MSKNYKIIFMSLRAGTTYTLHIGGGTGTEVQLLGGAHPFVTQEDDSDDAFTAVRTQSGYLRIVDNGLAADGVTAFDWKDLLPQTDTDRPVWLTDDDGVTVWQGFMQAQNFGGTLYGNPQEREFPVQCSLAVTEGTDINYTEKDMHNFAYLLKQIVDSIPSACRPSTFYIQGGAHARVWLQTLIDWQNYVMQDGDYELSARFNMLQCLNDMCRFWGWTARTCSAAMWLTCMDDSSERSFLVLTTHSLGYLAADNSGESTAGTIVSHTAVSLTGNIFASTDNDDFRMRGASKATVTSDVGSGDEDVADPFQDTVVAEMESSGEWGPVIQYQGKVVRYTTPDMLTKSLPFLTLSARDGYGSFNVARVRTDENDDWSYINVMRILKTGSSSVNGAYVSLETVYEHQFSDGFLRMFGETWRLTERYINAERHLPIGRCYMWMRIGIGSNRASAMWYNGQSWQSTQTAFYVRIGNEENFIDNNLNEFYFSSSLLGDQSNIINVNGLRGRLFIDFLGTDDSALEEISGQRSFEIKDLRIEFKRNPSAIKWVSPSNIVKVDDVSRPSRFEYWQKNTNAVRDEWNADCIYGTENGNAFSYGEIVNPDGSFCETVPYGTTMERPEQHVADRVAAYWAEAKRKLSLNLLSNVVQGSVAIGNMTPGWLCTIDGTTCHPISIGHDWRDDVTKVTMIEMG